MAKKVTKPATNRIGGRDSKNGQFVPLKDADHRPGRTQRERIPMPGYGDTGRSSYERERDQLPARNARTGSFTTVRSTRDIKTGSTTLSSTLKRLAKR